MSSVWYRFCLCAPPKMDPELPSPLTQDLRIWDGPRRTLAEPSPPRERLSLRTAGYTMAVQYCPMTSQASRPAGQGPGKHTLHQRREVKISGLVLFCRLGRKLARWIELLVTTCHSLNRLMLAAVYCRCTLIDTHHGACRQ